MLPLYVMKHKRFDFGVFWVLNSSTQSESDCGQRALSFCVEVAGKKVLTEFAKDSKEINAVNKRFWKENVYMTDYLLSGRG